jgi:hypothetical protein
MKLEKGSLFRDRFFFVLQFSLMEADGRSALSVIMGQDSGNYFRPG